MRNSKEIIHRQTETVEIERPFEPQMPATNGGHTAHIVISMRRKVFSLRLIGELFAKDFGWLSELPF